MPRPIQILLADDHWVVRAGLRTTLDAQPNLRVVGEAATGEEAVEKARTLKPDVVLMDLLMPGIGGLEALRRIAALPGGTTKILVLSVHLQEDTLLAVLEAGGSGFVTKTATAEDLKQAIRMVAQNEVFLDPGAARVLVDHYKEPHTEAKGALARLSVREREVLALTAEGHSSTEIGKQLRLSPKTVDTYRARIMDKLGVKHRSELVRFALRAGLLKLE